MKSTFEQAPSHVLIRDDVENAVRLQTFGYQLLKWLEKALGDGSSCRALIEGINKLKQFNLASLLV